MGVGVQPLAPAMLLTSKDEDYTFLARHLRAQHVLARLGELVEHRVVAAARIEQLRVGAANRAEVVGRRRAACVSIELPDRSALSASNQPRAII